MELTPAQEKKLKRVVNIVENGDLAIAEYLFELEENFEAKVEEIKQESERRIAEIKSNVPDLGEILASIKGKDSKPEEVAEILVNDESFVRKLTPEDGHTPTDQELLVLIKPLIPKVENGKTPTKEQLVALIRPLIPDLKDGETPSDERLTTLIQSLLPKEGEIVDRIEKDLPKLGEAIRDALELLQEEEKLDKKAIKGLEEWLKKIEKRTSRGGDLGPTPVVGGRDLIKIYDVSSQLDGISKTFNIPANWVVLDVRSSSFPYAFRYGVDYTYTPTTILFTSEINAAGTLAFGQTLQIIYVTA